MHSWLRTTRGAWLVGSVPALLIYVWVITVGGWDLTQHFYVDDMFDAQARAIFHGRLDIPEGIATVEGFVRNGKTYIYFGIWPALLRMPLLLVTDALDGQLTTLSMVLSLMVLAIASCRLSLNVREMFRGLAVVGRVEWWATAALAFAVLTGPPLFLASGAVVYNEAIAWGLAWSVAGLDAVVRWQREPSGRRLVAAGVIITLAMLSRQAVALGPLVALALAGGWRLWQGRRPKPSPRLAVWLAVALLVPTALSEGLHFARMGQWFGLPFERQVFWQGMQDELAAADTNQLDLRNLPLSAGEYLRPVGVQLRSDFPWIDYRRDAPDRRAGFGRLDWTASLPSTAPALCLFSAIGVAWGIRNRGRRDLMRYVLPLASGAVAGAVVTMLYRLVGHRYVADLYPVVLVGGMVGFYVLARTFKLWPSRARLAALTVMAVLVVAGSVINLSLALETQRERWMVVPEPVRASWVGLRVNLPGSTEQIRVGRDSPMPSVRNDALLVVGDCDGLYIGMRGTWQPVKRGPGVGFTEYRLDVDEFPVGVRTNVMTMGEPHELTTVGLFRVDDNRVRIDVDPPGGDWMNGHVLRRKNLNLQLDADRRIPQRFVKEDYLPRSVILLPVGSLPTVLASEEQVKVKAYDPSICRKATSKSKR